jgi:protocatechuate 3,4-dioxygenase beta subunit
MTSPRQHGDDLHDQGLQLDLATIAAGPPATPGLARRRLLQMAGLGTVGIVLAACGKDGGSATGSTTTTSSAGGTSTTAASAGGSVTATPEETGGPFPGDGSNGPNVLTDSGVVRQDIRPSFGAYSGTASGLPLTIRFELLTAGTGAPLAGAALYAWHCTQGGGYSLYSPGVTDQNYLRGVQEADDDGVLSFQSVFPAAYDGRWPHVHFEVYESLDTASSAGSKLLTSQIALPEDTCHEVYATSGYEASVSNLARTSLDSDMVFRDGWDQELGTITGTVGEDDLTVTLTVGVEVPEER